MKSPALEPKMPVESKLTSPRQNVQLDALPVTRSIQSPKRNGTRSMVKADHEVLELLDGLGGGEILAESIEWSW